MPTPYSFIAYRDLTLEFEGERVQLDKGDKREFRDPCRLLRFIQAVKEAARRTLPKGQQGLIDKTREGIEHIESECESATGLAPPELTPPSELPDMPEPSRTGSDEPAAPDGETADSLDAPDPQPMAEISSESRTPGESDGRPLSEQYYDPQNPMPDYDVVSTLSREGIPPDRLESELQRVLYNEPPEDELHSYFGRDDRESPFTTIDPVNVFTGQYTLTSIDVEIPSRGFPLQLTRVYHSGPVYFGPWGYNWDHNYNVYLREFDDGSVAVWTGRLTEDKYKRSRDGSFEPPVGIFRILERQAAAALHADRYVLTDRDGMQQIFERPDGWPHPDRIPLVRIEDQHGNAHTLLYNAEGRLERVEDHAGRFIRFIYGDCALLEQLTDHTGRIWRYGHDPEIEHLIAVTTPAIPEYPEGLTTCYEYDRYHGHPQLRHNLLRVIDPGGNVVVENQYSDDPSTEDFGRVVYQNFAGWQATLHASRLQWVPRIPRAINVPAWRVEVVDPGFLTVYTFNYRGDLLDSRFRLVRDGSYRLVARTYRYDEQGNMVVRREPNGLGLLATFDFDNGDPRARGNPLRFVLTGPPTAAVLDREIIRLTYEDRYHRVKTIRDETGATTTFIYDYEEQPTDHGDVIRVEYPDVTLPDGSMQEASGRVTYNTFGQVTARETAEGYRHEFSYFLSGAHVGLMSQVRWDTDGADQRQIYEYDEWGNLARITDAAGNVREYEHDPLGRLTRLLLPKVDGMVDEVRYRYGPNGRIRRQELPRGTYDDEVITDAFIANEFQYDGLGHLTEAIYGTNTAAPRRWRFERDAEGNVLRTVDPLGTTTVICYDERNLTLEQTVAAGTPDTATWRMVYDRNGNRTAIIDPGGLRTDVEYDPWDRIHRVFMPGLPDERTVVEYEHAPRNDLRAIEVRGMPQPGAPRAVLGSVSYEYDERQRPFRRTADGIAHTAWYDRDNQLVRLVNVRGHATTFDIDGLGRVTAHTDALGNQIRREFDAAGNLTAIEEEEVDVGGGAITYRTVFETDARSRVTAVTDPLGNSLRTEYDARSLPVAFVDPLGLRVEHHHDLDGNIVRRTATVGSPPTIVEHRWARDLLGRIFRYTDPEGAETRFAHTPFHRLAKITYNDGSSREWVYQPETATQLSHEVMPSGTRVDYEHDVSGMIRKLSFTTGSGVAPTADLEIGYDGLGRPVLLDQNGKTLSRQYDSSNRLVAERYDDRQVTMAYNDGSGTVDLTYPDGRMDRMHLDALGRIESVALEAVGTIELTGPNLTVGDELVRYGYTGPTRPAYRVLGNCTRTDYCYDGGRRLAGLIHRDAAGGVLTAVHYVYDAAGRRRVVHAGPAPLEPMLYNYDELSRLTERLVGVSVGGPPTVSTQADADAYIARVSTPSPTRREIFSLNRADDRLGREVRGSGGPLNETYTVTSMRQVDELRRAEAGTSTTSRFMYSPDGALRSDDRRRFTYDALDRLVRIENDTGVPLLEFRYDPAGRLSERIVNGTTTGLVHFAGRCLQENEEGGVPRLQRVFGIGIDELILQSRTDNAWCHQDVVHSLMAASDDTGGVTERYAYGGFGEPSIWMPDGSTARSTSAINLQPRFGGHAVLPGTELYLTRSRLYDSVTGRYAQRDPMGYSDSPCPYVYAAHDPLNFVDPTGRFIFTAIAVGAIVGALAGTTYGVHQGHTGWELVGDAAIGLGIGAVAGATGGLAAEALAGAAGVGTLVTTAGAATSTTAGLSTAQTIALTGSMSALEGYVVRSQLSSAYPTVVHPPNASTMIEDYSFGVATGVFIRGAEMLGSGRSVSKLFHKTNDISEIRTFRTTKTGESFRQIWGRTEGRVYASHSPEIPGVGRKVRDPGKIFFEGQATELFQPHPVDGPFSGYKRVTGQFVTQPGDILVTQSAFDAERRILTVTGARMGPHDPNIPRLWGLFGERARRAGRLGTDQFLTGAGHSGMIFAGAEFEKDLILDPLVKAWDSLVTRVPDPLGSTAKAPSLK